MRNAIANKNKIAAVILAAGRGERMGGNFKQFLPINNKPLIFYSLEEFVNYPFVQQIIVVVPQEKLSYAKETIYQKFGKSMIRIIVGGKTRRESAYNALQYLDRNNRKSKINYVVIHDASRPMISAQLIDEVVKEAMRYGAAVVGTPAIDLIFEVNKQFITRAFDKEKIYYGFTPQCFRFDLIRNAYFRNQKNFGHSDSIQLIKKLYKNLKIRVVHQYPNLKVTHKEDIAIIKFLLKNRWRQ